MTKVFTTALFFMLTGYVHAACTTPSGAAGRMEYFSTEGMFKYCNGTNWLSTGGPKQFTADPGACNAGAEGTIKYTGGTPPWEYCDGTTWTDFPSSGGAGGGGGGGSANAACAGEINDIGGYCWYGAGGAQSCDTVCASAGLSCNLEGTRDYAGSGGDSLANNKCATIVSVLAYPTGSNASPVNVGVGVGCAWSDTYFDSVRDNVTTTTCSATYTDEFSNHYYRMCACD